MNMNNTNDLKEKLDMYEKPPRKSRKTFATDTFKMLNNRMLYYRKVLSYEPTTGLSERRIKQQQKIKNKLDKCIKIKKLLHRATRHLYDDSNITPQTLVKEAKFRALKVIHR